MKIVTKQSEDGSMIVEAVYASESSNILEVDINNIPSPEMVKGKRAEMRFNPDTNELYYVYVDLPLSETEELLLEKLKKAELENAELKTKQELMQKAIDDIILGGVM